MFCVANAICKINSCSAVPLCAHSQKTWWRTQRKYVGVPWPSCRKVNQLQMSGCVLSVDLDSWTTHTKNIYQGFYHGEVQSFGKSKIYSQEAIRRQYKANT